MQETLDSQGTALLRYLVSQFSRIEASNPTTFVSYKEALDGLGLPDFATTSGLSLKNQGLDSLANWAHAKGLPAITGMIITRGTLSPGPGFFSLYGKKDPEDYEWWLSEIAKSKAFDWSEYFQENPKEQFSNSQQTTLALPRRIRDIVQDDSRIFLKSEYGVLSDFWPVVAFSSAPAARKLQREYKPGADFILYTTTAGPETEDKNLRGRLPSIMRIDKTRIYETKSVIPLTSWEWAEAHYPEKWEHAFQVLQGWEISPAPQSKDIVPSFYSVIGRYPYRGGVIEVTGDERLALLNFEIKPLKLPPFRGGYKPEIKDAVARDKVLNAEALRIANLVFNRVKISGQVVTRNAPERNAPTDFFFQVAELLRAIPLLCGLCGGEMSINAANSLLKVSPDRIDSKSGEYGPENFQLTHLACNHAKNAGTVAEFNEWLKIAAASCLLE
jgi:hypothetical protein